MESKIVTVSRDLSHLIKEYSHIKLHAGNVNEYDHIVIDDGCYDFVFFKGEGASMEYGDGKSIKITNSAFTIHQLKPPHRLVFDHELEFFIAKVQPWANTLFFPLIIEAGIVDLGLIFPDRISKLYETIFNSSDVSEAIKLFESFIYSLNIQETDNLRTIKSVCEKIYETHGTIKVNELVNVFDINRQILNKRFKQHVHYTIKQFIKIVRIIALIKFKIDNSQMSLTDAAYTFNYSDQAHFNNDFKRVCGISPLIFFKNLPIFFQRHKK